MLTLLIGAVIGGAIVGGLGRLILPGRQDIGWFATIAAGIVASGVGTGIAYLLGFHERTWLVIVVQLVLAVLCVAAVTSMLGKKSRS
ncbi:GlsB/YeaQ/YmgE family stress response membrane protein [Nonomuraea sp. NPDC050153]|uniref:GlsB/YeaQ/YmgE family stress response membrane protein n=1 Tax=Nonomuraea sp. NPDC050153 TaxID=3364359 RepID=UPI0037A88507